MLYRPFHADISASPHQCQLSEDVLSAIITYRYDVIRYSFFARVLLLFTLIY